MSSFTRGCAQRFSRKFLAIALLAPLSADAAPVRKPAIGIAWQVQGTWLAEGSGTPLRSGDAVKPASLLQPGTDSGNHSITVLLPDGQRVLYECFTFADCARGFRVPALTVAPNDFSVDLLTRIQSVLAAKAAATAAHDVSHAITPSREEAVAVFSSTHRVHIAGLLAELPNGRYSYDLRPLGPAASPARHLAFEKTQPFVELTLPAAGLYNIIITDAQNNPRIDLLLAAISPAQSACSRSFRRARGRMEQWNDDYAGWPIHDFLRAYLESLMRTTYGNRTSLLSRNHSGLYPASLYNVPR
jgi:hypothetical protein